MSDNLEIKTFEEHLETYIQVVDDYAGLDTEPGGICELIHYDTAKESVEAARQLVNEALENKLNSLTDEEKEMLSGARAVDDDHAYIRGFMDSLEQFSQANERFELQTSLVDEMRERDPDPDFCKVLTAPTEPLKAGPSS